MSTNHLKPTPPNARGQGRKPLAAGEHSVVVTLRLTPAQRDKLRELGGAAWVRAQLGGSGSTLIAAQKANRQARLMELDPRYCDVIVKRWQDFTGKIATHAETGEHFAEVKDGSKEAKN